ncbi:hypothetical protein GCM10023093_12380 [Nemorincola caseinilytica]|uniref:DUF177 domain-containing protein n=1 Tax=Nemorincola caseinilytica TaxID=2054315 RepID=A0ABP8N9R9_9BACT
MKHNWEFEIAWQGLKPGPHTYIYDIDDRFMQEREAGTEFRNWNARITLGFDKHENFFMLNFDIDGKVTVACDRCGDDLELRLWDEFDLLIKLTGGDDEHMPDDEDDVVFIPRSETVIDISAWLYEFMMLSVPLQRIHPDRPDGDAGCNPEALRLLDRLSEGEAKADNPLWKGLEALKGKKDTGKGTKSK